MIDITNWEYFKISDYFTVKGSTTTSLDCLKNDYGEGKYPYVTTQSINNGVKGFYDYYTDLGNVIVVDSAVIGTATYQPENFSASDHVEKLIPRFSMNQYQAFFIVTILNKENYRYCYGRKFNQGNIKNTKILLPAKKADDGSVTPDWQWMEEYIKSLNISIPKSSVIPSNNNMNTDSWMEFKLSEIFSEIDTGGDLIYRDIISGGYPVIGHKEENHGVSCYTEFLDNRVLYNHDKVLSLGDRGSFIAYVQPRDFYIGTRVKALVSKNPNSNVYQLMFLATCINLEQYKFCYGRNATDKTPNIKIRLPAIRTNNGEWEPDWQYMENYIKSLSYGDCI